MHKPVAQRPPLHAAGIDAILGKHVSANVKSLLSELAMYFKVQFD